MSLHQISQVCIVSGDHTPAQLRSTPSPGGLPQPGPGVRKGLVFSVHGIRHLQKTWFRLKRNSTCFEIVLLESVYQGIINSSVNIYLAILEQLEGQTVLGCQLANVFDITGC